MTWLAKAKPVDSAANLGVEAKLWLTADKMRSNMDVAGPSGARQTTKGSAKGECGGANQYKAEKIPWVPPAARPTLHSATIET